MIGSIIKYVGGPSRIFDQDVDYILSGFKYSGRIEVKCGDKIHSIVPELFVFKEKYTCVNNIQDSFKHALTLSKKYTISPYDSKNYLVKTDTGATLTIPATFFKTDLEIRRDKIKEIL